jgi:hypothetical protein
MLSPPKLLILLGAGASQGNGPSTAWLTRRLLASRSGLKGAPVFRLIDRTLKRRLSSKDLFGGRETFEPNFEEIIQVVDDIATHLPAEHISPYGSSLLGPFLTLNRSLQALKPDRKRYSRYASRAREFILQETKRHCDEASDPRALPLVAALRALGQRARLRLMSVNYDDLPAVSAIDFYTGFVDGQGAAQVFRPVHPWPQDRHLWCQLHGSLLFRVRQSMTDVGRYPEIVRYRSRREAARRKWIDIDWVAFQDRHVAPVAPIITALRKADAIQREPYAHYAHVFREEALSCDRWLIIGYGGGDDHINTVLSQARRHWRESGREHRVLVVGFAPGLAGVSLISAMEQRPASGLGREMWLFDEETYPLDARIRPCQVSEINSALGLTLDGVDWAMGEGLPTVMRFLRMSSGSCL